MNFIKQNLHRIIRVLGMQIGIMVFAMIVSLTANAMAEDQRGAMGLVASIFSICFYLFLVFYCMREEGSRDSVRIEAGRLAYDGFYGFKIGLAAVAPNYIFVLLMAIGVLIGIGSGGAGVFLVGYYALFFFLSMYSGVLKSLLGVFGLTTSPVAGTIAFAVVPLFAALAAWLGYAYGVKHPTADRRNGGA